MSFSPEQKKFFLNSKNSEAFFDPSQNKSEIDAIDKELSSPEVWKNQKKLQSLQQNKKRLERDVQISSSLYKKKEEFEVLVELAEEGEDVDKEITDVLASLQKDLAGAELQMHFYKADDVRNAIFTIHPGAGGTESQDWSQILLRMYLRYAERKGFKTEILDILHGDEAGLKSVTVRV
ncbi:MAG: PCRF domain-containing protein, partial [Candidatus Aminicenantes bacterium]|nr:PCRF domain-containing protein [Candidatus Aminicenantes bacterium]